MGCHFPSNLRVNSHLSLEHKFVNNIAFLQDLFLRLWEEEEPPVYYRVNFCDRLRRQPICGVGCASRERQGDATRGSDEIGKRREALVFRAELPCLEVV